MVMSSESSGNSRLPHEVILFLVTAIGAAFGTSKAGVGIAGLGSFRPERIMKASLAIATYPMSETHTKLSLWFQS
jgi:hypothetical protein